MNSREHSAYEQWMALVRLRPRLHQRSIAFLGLIVAAAIVGVGVIAQTRASGIVAGIVAATATLTILAAYVILWVEVSGRVHWYLVRKVEWNDLSRLSLILTAFFGFPVVTIGPLLLIILLTNAK